METVLPSPPRPCPRRFVWALPAVFALFCVLGSIWPGDHGRMFTIGAIAGLWVGLLPFELWGQPMVPSLIGGVLVMGLFGRMLDRLRAPWWPWLLGTPISAAVAAFVMVQTHEDAAVAFGSVGGFLAGAVCALQLGSYAATVVALALGVGRATGV